MHATVKSAAFAVLEGARDMEMHKPPKSHERFPFWNLGVSLDFRGLRQHMHIPPPHLSGKLGCADKTVSTRANSDAYRWLSSKIKSAQQQLQTCTTQNMSGRMAGEKRFGTNP